MSLYNYLVKSNEPFYELRSEFDHEQITQLHKLLKGLGFTNYLAFVREHQEDILKYIGLSPSRRQQKKWVNHPDILLIRYAALQLSAATVQLLADIEPIERIVDRGSYREFHAAIAQGIAPCALYSPLLGFFRDYENPFS